MKKFQGIAAFLALLLTGGFARMVADRWGVENFAGRLILCAIGGGVLGLVAALLCLVF